MGKKQEQNQGGKANIVNKTFVSKLAEILASIDPKIQIDILNYPEVRALIEDASGLLKVLPTIAGNPKAQEILQKDKRLAGFFEEVRLSVAAVCFAAQQKMMRENCPEPVLEQ